MLRLLNYDLADIYFPMYIIQLNYDILDQRNRTFKQPPAPKDQDKQAQMQNQNDLGVHLHESMIEEYRQKCKFFFVLRDQWLLTKVQITGVLVYYIKKEDKHFFGIDDTTGTICCVLWLNDFNNSRGKAASSRQ